MGFVMNADSLNRVYDVLMEETGIDNREAGKEWFAERFSANGVVRPVAWALGRTGFVTLAHKGNRLFVDCDPDEYTPEREEIIKRTNARLAQLEMD